MATEDKYHDKKFKGFVCSPTATSRKSKSKDTKKWCRGKVGIEHKMAWVDPYPNQYTRIRGVWYDYLCAECGKKFDYCSKFWTGRRGGSCRCGNHKKEDQ